jgi:hypothetical protein
MPRTIFLPVAIASYPNLFTPQAPKDPRYGTTPAYSCTFIFSAASLAKGAEIYNPAKQTADPQRWQEMCARVPKSLEELNNHIYAEYLEKWPEGSRNRPSFTDVRNFRNPLYSGADGTKADKPGYGPGTYYIAARQTNLSIPPRVVDRYGKETKDESVIYPGCYVLAQVRLNAYDNAGRGIGVYLVQVQVIADGERLGGGSIDADAFAPIEEPDFAPPVMSAQPMAAPPMPGAPTGNPFQL